MGKIQISLKRLNYYKRVNILSLLIDNPALLIAMVLWMFFIPRAIILFYRFIKNSKRFIEKDLRRISEYLTREGDY